MKSYLLIIFSIIASTSLYGQEKKELSTKFNGLPFTLISSSENCIQSISVNQIPLVDSTFGKTFTIHFEKLGFTKYDNLFIEIIHLNDCYVNPILPAFKKRNCLNPDSLILIDSSNTLIWSASKQTVAELFTVERLYEGEWTTIGTFSGFEQTYQFEIPEVKILIGTNQFRVRTRDQLINHYCTTNSVTIKKEKAQLVEMKFDKFSKVLTFSSPTDFVIINDKQHAMVIKKNLDNYNLSKFPKGKYQVKFNNNKGLEPILIKKPGVIKEK